MNNFNGISMTTGYSQDIAEQVSEQYIENTMILLGVFTQDAMKLASIYCMHANRIIVCKNDIGLALKTRAFHGDDFWNRSDIQQRIATMREYLNEEESFNSDSDLSESEVSEGEVSEIVPDEVEMECENTDEDAVWTPSTCTCEVCLTLNQIDVHWDTWNPTDRNNISIKNGIIQALM